MTGPKRPSLAKKHTRQTKRNTDTFLDSGFQWVIDGETYAVTIGDLNALDAREMRHQVGMTFVQVYDAILTGVADLDCYAAVIWMARRVNGGEFDLPFDDVAAEIGYEVLGKIREGLAAERKRLAGEGKAAKKTAKKVVAVPDVDYDEAAEATA